MPSHGKQEIYVIQHELGPVKIGRAKNPLGRMRSMQVACPFRLKLKKTKTPHDAKEVEDYLHDRFKKYHMRGEWFDIPLDERDFEIPTHLSKSGRPNVPVEITEGRDLDDEWAEALDRFFRAMKITKYHTVSIERIREEFQELAKPRDLERGDEGHTLEDSDLYDVAEDIPKGKVQCSSCGHHFDHGSGDCPMCGTNEFVDESFR